MLSLYNSKKILSKYQVKEDVNHWRQVTNEDKGFKLLTVQQYIQELEWHVAAMKWQPWHMIM